MIKTLHIGFCLVLLFCVQASRGYTRTGKISLDKAAKTITITTPDKNLSILINYSSGCTIQELKIRGDNKLSPAGIYSSIQTNSAVYGSNDHQGTVQVAETAGRVTLSGIKFGEGVMAVTETWRFVLNENKIDWDIIRDYDQDGRLQDMAMPKWNFKDLSVWKGGIFDNGGMVWCKYLKQPDDTYGVHTGGVTFWNARSGQGLGITAKTDHGHAVAAKYSHGKANEFTFTQLVSQNPLQQRYNLSRFVSGKEDVFAPIDVKKGQVSLHLVLQYVDYFVQYSRGKLAGIDADGVRELLNTTGRYGVVDNNIVGANGWTSNWKCLHEPFFAQIGLAVDDSNYTRNLCSTLDQERLEAITSDGRVLSRWHDVPGDEMPGTYNAKTGYYEAMWGYTVDSQTGYVINLSEAFDMSGDLNWLRSHKASAEKALGWLIKRDENNNGIFEMVNKNTTEHKASDWLDIVYASYENSFVNAQMYEALNLWANCEKVMGDSQKAAYYSGLALKLKTAFNKPVEEGGFWSSSKKQYVYWRDKDGSVHGDNLVTPVNFAAIAFGICDDKERISEVLDQIEKRTAAEHLFHWPLCLDSFKREEVQEGNWPFPRYENGDIFPTWGYLGIRAYAGYHKEIALKYIRNILKQYQKDGLSSQRYSRKTQLGQGDDILAGICTTVTGLYRDIYGIRPKWNRMGLEPHMMATLNGTQFNYRLRGTLYQLKLSVGDYKMRTNGFSVKSNERFGAAKLGNTLTYYHHNKDSRLLQIDAASAGPIDLEMELWKDKNIAWTMTSPGRYTFNLTGMGAGRAYQLLINHSLHSIKAGTDGHLTFTGVCGGADGTKFILKSADGTLAKN